MASTIIQVKRGNSTNFGAVTLQEGEPAFVLDQGKLYIGDGTNNVLINPMDTTVNLVAGDYTKVTVNALGQVTGVGYITANDLPSIPFNKVEELGTAAKKNIGISSGNIPVLDANGKLDTTIIPSIAITDVYTVNTYADLTSLTNSQVGDIAIAIGENSTYILKQEPYSVLNNWVRLLSPTQDVASVNGKTGVVLLTLQDLQIDLSYTPIQGPPIMNGDTLTQAIGKLEGRFFEYTTINDFNTAINSLQVQNTNIGMTVGQLQGDVSALQGQVGYIQGEVGQLQLQVTNIQGDMGMVLGEIGALRGQMTNVQGDVSTLQGQVTNVQGDMGQLQLQIATTQTDITALQTQVATIEASIDGGTF